MDNISVILNVYKRPYSLEKQIEAIKNQSIPVKSENIHVWYNKSGVEQKLPNDPKINTYQCNWNTKFHGRFTIPLLCRTEYIAVFDDDVIPGKDWFKSCLETMKKHNGVLGSAGVELRAKRYQSHQKVGWNGEKDARVRKVDLVGHAWFFRQEWSKFLWQEEPISWDNGEDMAFSYLCQKNGIDTFVPPHPPENVEIWGNVPGRDNGWGMDKNASYIVNRDHYSLRDKIVIELINRGWKTVRKISK